MIHAVNFGRCREMKEEAAMACKMGTPGKSNSVRSTWYYSMMWLVLE